MPSEAYAAARREALRLTTSASPGTSPSIVSVAGLVVTERDEITWIFEGAGWSVDIDGDDLTATPPATSAITIPEHWLLTTLRSCSSVAEAADRVGISEVDINSWLAGRSLDAGDYLGTA